MLSGFLIQPAICCIEHQRLFRGLILDKKAILHQ